MILIETHIVDVYTNHGVAIFNGFLMENEYNTLTIKYIFIYIYIYIYIWTTFPSNFILD